MLYTYLWILSQNSFQIMPDQLIYVFLQNANTFDRIKIYFESYKYRTFILKHIRPLNL